MCGIFCLLLYTEEEIKLLEKEFENFQLAIKNRGPDKFKSVETGNIYLAASVLWLQGEKITEQPIDDEYGLMAYNGDIYEGLKSGQQKTGDTYLFFVYFKEVISKPDNFFAEKLSVLNGPYAFIYLDKKNNKLYFGRDIYGRRSLLLGKNKTNETLVLTSVGKKNTNYEFIEVPSIGIFCIDCNTGHLNIYKWSHENQNFSIKLTEFQRFIDKEINVVGKNQQINHIQKLNPNGSIFKLLQSLMPTDNVFQILQNSPGWLGNIINLQSLLEYAVKIRITKQPRLCKACIKTSDYSCQHATTGVLFSGGVDCAILAFICDKFVEPDRPIDLINVSFDEVHQYKSPDRITGIQTLEELQKTCPKRTWNFLEVNISKHVLDEKRINHIADLIYPLNTILDDSLGCALWFAAQGKAESYVSNTRVLIVGMGADELFGGYTKHRAALKRSSWDGLNESLENDWQNLPYRNLGRDDRVVADHGRQLRTPYLDEKVVAFVRNLPCWERTFPAENLPQGIGEKILLRSLAYHYGLKTTATLKKRALQFGSRIANSKENANDISMRLV